MAMPTLTLFEDFLIDGTVVALPAAPRMVLVVHGALTVGERNFAEGETWHGEAGATVQAGPAGAALWRWELTQGPAPELRMAGVRTIEKLAAPLQTLPDGELLLRGDSVAFPAGGCAYRHVHQGPGIRCLIEGGIRIDVHGRSASYGPGGAWFEAGPDPVFAQAADRASRFIRVMILPRGLLGRSSIRYVDPADADRPKSQTYKIYVDAPIRFEDAAAP